MRFGRKLALQVTADQSGAPYLSHKAMKEAINKTVRELRLYQSTVQTLEGLRTGTALPAGDAAALGDAAEMEGRIFAFDQQLFKLVNEDMLRIFSHVRLTEAQLEQGIADLQAKAIGLGLLVDEQQLERLERSLPFEPESRTALCRQLLSLRCRSDPASMARQLADVADEYNTFVAQIDEHTQYLEINVAGFRKLLKRHEKQIPHRFHACPTPFLDFHRLVTRTSRQLAEAGRVFGSVVADARHNLCAAVAGSRWREGAPAPLVAETLRLCERPAELAVPKGLGPECEMVLEIQRRLRDPTAQVLLQQAAQPGAETPAGMLYPKPGALPQDTALLWAKPAASGGGGGPAQGAAASANTAACRPSPYLPMPAYAPCGAGTSFAAGFPPGFTAVA